MDTLIAPLALFVSFYVATFALLAWLRFPLVQWSGLLSVSVATALTVSLWDRGRWPLGLFVPVRTSLPELLLGAWWGIALIGFCAVLVTLSTEVRPGRGAGFPWLEFFSTFLPAAVHEELLFRGYPFQRLFRWHRAMAILLVAAVFAALHAGNESVSTLGLTNVFLGGVLLGLAYARYERLWFPIGLHLAWNVMTGPILGHEVSGYESLRTVFVELGSGPVWLTGGEFGLEGSAWMTLVELVAIFALLTNWSERSSAGRKRHSG